VEGAARENLHKKMQEAGHHAKIRVEEGNVLCSSVRIYLSRQRAYQGQILQPIMAMILVLTLELV
jgi:hypothetical protein